MECLARTKRYTKRPFWQSFPENMRILLLTENPVLALGLEAALRQAGHTSLMLSSNVAQLQEQMVALRGAPQPPNVLVLDMRALHSGAGTESGAGTDSGAGNRRNRRHRYANSSAWT